jgi:hypothetical protein
MTNKVRIGSNYFYVPNGLDRCDPKTALESGAQVKVIKSPYGCPPSGTMGHTYVGELKSGKFIGLVHCNSLHTAEEYRAYLMAEIAKKEPVNA